MYRDASMAYLRRTTRVKLYILGQTSIDYLEIWEFTEIVGVYSTKAKAVAAAKRLKLESYSIEVRKLDS